MTAAANTKRRPSTGGAKEIQHPWAGGRRAAEERRGQRRSLASAGLPGDALPPGGEAQAANFNSLMALKSLMPPPTRLVT
jgi:hypothetical protein